MSVSAEEYSVFLKTYSAIVERVNEIAAIRKIKGQLENIDFFDLYIQATFYDDPEKIGWESDRTSLSVPIYLLWDPDWRESLRKIIRKEKEIRLTQLEELSKQWGEKSFAAWRFKPEMKALKEELARWE